MTHSPTNSPSSGAGLLLRRQRREAGLTQEELAERAGISARAVSDIERGIRTSIYRDTAERLATALGLDSEQRNQLVAASRRVPVGPPRLGNLPAPPPTPLFGRERELDCVSQLVRGGTRLLTITGPPGVGKSRLSLEAARAVAAQSAGAWFVSLAPIGSPDGVPSAVLQALELADAGDTIERIAHRVPAGSLLVIDNFEHVLDAAPWLGHLLDACPSITVLVTSRAPLRLRAEREFRLSALDDDAAMQVFRERTSAVRPDQSWADHEVALARRICRRLDGIPLALELGAAATAHLTLGGLADGLDAELDVLGEGWRDMPMRHRSMQAAIAWSFNLLCPADRELMSALSVFAGTFGIHAMVSVSALDAPVLVHRLARLVEQSLVRLADEVSEGPRYQLLELVRQTAAREAEQSGHRDTYRSRHLDHYIRLAEESEPHLHGLERGEWSDLITADWNNFNAALDYAEAINDSDRGLRLTTALWRWWRQRGAINPGRARLRRWLELPAGSPALRARALWGATWLALHQQDKNDARRWSEELLELAKLMGSGLARRNALTGLGMVARFEGRAADSLPLFREAETLAREAGDPRMLATSIFNIGPPLMEIGRLLEAAKAFDDARFQFLEIGDVAFASRVSLYQAMGALLAGDSSRASREVIGAAEVFGRLGEPWGEVECLEIGAAILASVGRNEAAAAALDAAAMAHQVLGSAQLGPDAALMAPIFDKARARAGRACATAPREAPELQLEEALSKIVVELTSEVVPT